MKVSEQARAAREAAWRLAAVPTGVKDRALAAVARALAAGAEGIVRGEREGPGGGGPAGAEGGPAQAAGLEPQKVAQLVAGVREVGRLPDPVGRGCWGASWTRASSWCR